MALYTVFHRLCEARDSRGCCVVCFAFSDLLRGCVGALACFELFLTQADGFVGSSTKNFLAVTAHTHIHVWAQVSFRKVARQEASDGVLSAVFFLYVELKVRP